MIGLLAAGGTQFNQDTLKTHNNNQTFKKHYTALFKKFEKEGPGMGDKSKGASNRKEIHQHHKNGKYDNDAINAHHAFLQYW